MPPRLKDIVRKLGRLGVAFFLLLALYVVLYVAAPAAGITTLVLLALYVTGLVWGFRLLRRNMHHIVWRLRNRLIVAYLFIAVVPVVLIFILVGIGGYILTGQAAVYMVHSELERRTAMLQEAASLIANAPPDQREAVVHEMAPLIQARLPGLTLLIRGGKEIRYPADADISAPPGSWKESSGLALRDHLPCSWAHIAKGDTRVTLVAPLTPELLDDMVPGIGQVFLGLLDLPSINRGPRNALLPRGRRIGRIPPAANSFDVNVLGLEAVYFPYWDAPDHQEKGALAVRTRPSAVLGAIFQRERVDVSQFWLVGFLIVAGIFVIVELFALRIGISITRSITQAVHSLYAGTERVKQADFSHRIEVRGDDQLADLGSSFNRMTENLERLILVEKEQERLKSEIAIAREVQNQLFPRGAPTMKTLELTGVCNAARMVSGDYYDFVRLQDSRVAIAIGDVAGKGISAALLMAAIQSIMRTQLTAGIPARVAAAHGSGDGSERPSLSTADLVGVLNRQIYATTSPEKYATFYFGMYDDESRLLRYTNAGHLPPILMRDGAAELLEVTGTVVGAFPAVKYEEKSIELRQGDLLVAYTDGIVEPENEYGEAFGEQRLIDLLLLYGERDCKEIIARIMETVVQWTATAELFDDMTLLLARGI